MPKAFRRVLRSEPHFHDVDSACQWCSVTQKFRERFPNIDPKFAVEQWVEQFLNRVQMESVGRLAGLTTTLQYFFEVCKVIARGRFGTTSCSNNVIEIPHGWTNAMFFTQVPSSTSIQFC